MSVTRKDAKVELDLNCMECRVAYKHELQHPGTARDRLIGNVEPWTIQTRDIDGD